MILFIDPSKTTGQSEIEGLFIVNNSEDAVETIKLMRYLQQYRPEKRVIEHVSMDDSETSLAVLASMEARCWDYQLRFRKKPTHAMQLILDRHNWVYVVQEDEE